ncbi:MAG: glycosyltransferase, partial [Parafilimonas terrae]|nr:glycosyltransferase [Parafilimonas terrae]
MPPLLSDRPVREEPNGLCVPLAGLAGRWIDLLLSTDPAAGLAGFALTFVAVDGRPGPLLPEAAQGTGAFLWTGRVPPEAVELRIATRQGTIPTGLRAVRLRRLPRPRLLLRGLRREPGLTLSAVSWRLRGKKVRARGLLQRALSHRRESGYPHWVRTHALSASERSAIAAGIAGWPDPPLISVLMPVHNPAPTVLAAALASLRAQLYPVWELCAVDDASTDPAILRLLEEAAAQDPRVRVLRRAENGHIARATNDALAMAGGAWCAFLDHDDLLAEDALYEVARAVRDDPELVLVYSDEDKIDAKGRRFEPHFKPDFDRELLHGQNYINHLTAVRTDALRAQLYPVWELCAVDDAS